MANNCPICGKDDQIKKVSAIVQSGVSRSTGQIPVGYSYTDNDGKLRSGTNYENFSTTHVSGLAERLLPPPPPNPPKSQLLYAYQLIIMVFGAMGFFAVSAFFIVSLITQSFGESTIFQGESPFALGAFTFLVSCMFAFFSKSLIKSQNERTKAFGIEKPMWERVMYRWEQLYYCERDDCIYVPNEKPVHVANIMEYINWHPNR